MDNFLHQVLQEYPHPPYSISTADLNVQHQQVQDLAESLDQIKAHHKKEYQMLESGMWESNRDACFPPTPVEQKLDRFLKHILFVSQHHTLLQEKLSEQGPREWISVDPHLQPLICEAIPHMLNILKNSSDYIESIEWISSLSQEQIQGLEEQLNQWKKMQLYCDDYLDESDHFRMQIYQQSLSEQSQKHSTTTTTSH